MIEAVVFDLDGPLLETGNPGLLLCPRRKVATLLVRRFRVKRAAREVGHSQVVESRLSRREEG